MRLKNLVRVGLLAVATFAAVAVPNHRQADAQQFSQPLNNASSVLAAAHVQGADTLVLSAGTGARFGTPTADAPVRVTVAARSTLVNGQIAPTSTATIYFATARSGDTLSGLTTVEGTVDRAYAKSDLVAATITAGTIAEVQQAVTGKADDASVVKLTGDQDVEGQKTLTPSTADGTALVVQGKSGQTGDLLQVKTATGATTAKIDADGTLVQDLSVSATGFTSKLKPPANSPPITFNTSVASFGNVPGGNGLNNSIWQAGWNLGLGSPVDPLWPTFRIGMESNYLVPQTGQQVLEGHLFATSLPGGPAELRTYSVYIDKNNAGDVQHKSQGTNWIWTTPYLAQQLMWLNRQSNGNVDWRIESDSSANGYPFQMVSVNSPSPTDVLSLGRTTSNNTQFTMRGTGSARWDMQAGGVTQTATLLNDGSNFSLIGLSNGGGMWNRTYGSWNVQNGSGSQTYMTIDSNGGTGLGLAGNARNVGLGGTSWANGVGVVAIKDAQTVPTANPTGGGILYSEGGALKWRSPAGTVTTIAPN